MHASIRVYRNAGSENELAKLVDERVLPAINTAPGFRTHYAVDVGDGVVASVSIFEETAGAEESNRMAADFVRADLASLLPNPPDIASGEVISCREA